MGYLEHFAPLVRSIACKLSFDPAIRDDLTQEGLLKVFSLSLTIPEPEIYSNDNTTFITRSVANRMRDYLRVERIRGSLIPEAFSKEEAFEIEQDPVSVSVSQIKRTIEAQDHRVLDEIYQPSENLNWFLRKRRIIYRQFNGLTEDYWGLYAMREYFNMSEWEFRQSVKRIRSAASAVFRIK